MKKLIMSIVALGLPLVVLTTRTAAIPPISAPLSAPTTVSECVPGGSHEVVNVPTDIPLLTPTETLKGKFYYPDPDGSGPLTFDPESLGAVAMTHGFPGHYDTPAMQSLANDLGKECFVVLAYNARGQSALASEANTLFHFWGEPERGDLSFVTNHLIVGPIPGVGGLDLVNDDLLAVMGFSQGGIMTWLAVTEGVLRGRFKVAIPYDGHPVSTEWLLGNDCVNANLAQFFYPANFRTPCPLGTPGCNLNAPGVSWDHTTFNDLRTAYVFTHPPNMTTLAAVINAREIEGELDDPVPGADYPWLFGISGWYDAPQPAENIIASYQVVAPPQPYPNYPPKRVLLTTGGHNNSNSPWAGSTAHRLYRRDAMVGWLHAYIGPFSDPPPPPPVANFSQVEFIVDSYNPSAPNPIPTFALRGSTTWPPAGATDRTYYLRAGGQALTTPPGPGAAADAISQLYTGPANYMETAVTESPAFDLLPTYLQLTPKIYLSEPLDQNYVLVGPPRVQLYADPVGTPPLSYQVHVRMWDELSGANRQFITRANACAWDESVPPGHFGGTTIIIGETRAHLFKAGSRIRFEVTTVDPETYWTMNNKMFITPRLGNFTVNIHRYDLKPTNITLKLLPVTLEGGQMTQLGLFPGESSQAPSPAGTPEPNGTPEPPQPLQLDATLYPDFTNPGGWRAWPPEVWLECSGGEGDVTCPTNQFLLTEGISQTFTFTATDTAGHVVTTTFDDMNIDLTPPQLTAALPVSQTFCSGATLPLDFSVGDTLSGLAGSTATFNGLPAADGNAVSLLAGANTLTVDSMDEAGNRVMEDVTVQVSYHLTKNFPPDGQNVNPLLPLAFAFQINDACAVGGYYGGASGTLWLTGPDGMEIPAEWFGLPSGNSFTYNALTGWYSFDADLSGLASGTWTARAHLDDGNDYSITFVVPSGLGGSEGAAADVADPIPTGCDAAGWLPRLLDLRRCR